MTGRFHNLVVKMEDELTATNSDVDSESNEESSSPTTEDSESNPDSNLESNPESNPESFPDSNPESNPDTHPPGSQRNGKLFLGGLSQDTTAADIQAYFKDFGVVKESFIKMDALTGRSRGFGFVIFVDPVCTDAVFKTGPHLIKGKQLDIKAAVPKHLTKDRGLGSRKVFVGGLSQMVTEEYLRFYFR